VSGNEVLVDSSSLGKDAENDGLSGFEQCGEPVAMILMARGKERIVMIPMRQIAEVLNPLIAILLRNLKSLLLQINQRKQSPCSSVVIGDVRLPSLMLLLML
jgi:hypothetical protein